MSTSGLPFHESDSVTEGLGLSLETMTSTAYQNTSLIDSSELIQLLKIQLEEIETIQSIYSNPGEFQMLDFSAIARINDFIEGNSVMVPPGIDFTINLVVDGKKLEISVYFPSDYPIEEADIFVRMESLSRVQHNQLISDFTKYLCSLPKGEVYVYQAMSWLQEKANSYLVCVEKKVKKPYRPTELKNNVNNKFSRYWIYSHHIYSNMKRKCIIDLAKEMNITGFCLPGKPGIICVEGLEADCSDWWQRIRSLTWKKIMCKKMEEETIEKGGSVDCFRKFTGFEEISFDKTKNKSRDCHMDMGELYKYLSDHQCGHVFKDYFGVEGRGSESVE